VPASLDRSISRRPGARWGRAWLRGRAALTALAFVLSSWFGVLHESTTTHVRCAQHGELMDTRAGGDAAARNALAVAPGTIEANVRDVAATTTGGHEHCALASAIRESRVVPASPALVAALVAVAEPLALAATVEAPRDRALYRTAPKTSPPA